VYFFAIDVSAAAHACGMVSVVSQTIRACLDQLPGDERTQVGFLTFDSSLHFYNLKASLAAPQVWPRISSAQLLCLGAQTVPKIMHAAQTAIP
jgi:hypothetical protein